MLTRRSTQRRSLMSDTRQKGWQTGDILLDEFLIEGVLGAGAMGTVYRVQRLFDDRIFAVKCLSPDHLENTAIRRLFLRELKTWVELPEHPNLVTCLFFRFIGERLAIFNEYMDGGSLLHWIQRGKLAKISTVLDIAIQMAWGIQEAHDHGLIHQDIKPANVLLDREGNVKITDFGLSRARNIAVEETTGESGDSDSRDLTIHATAGGMTPAYCSPEQAGRSRLTHRTDMWSWAVSVLEMFVGDTPWKLGTVAPSGLNTFLAAPPADAPGMPDALSDLLRKCFQYRTLDRWRSMDEIALQLIQIYGETTGRPYPRQKPELDEADQLPMETGRGSSDGEFQWRDPERWLNMAIVAAGKKRKEYSDLLIPFRGTGKTRALMDLEIIQEADHLMRPLMESADSRLKEFQWDMLRDRASICGYLSDFPAALNNIDFVIAARESHEETADPEALIQLYYRKSRLHLLDGNMAASVDAGEKSIALRKQVLMTETTPDRQFQYAEACSDLSATYDRWGQQKKALAILNTSDEVLDSLISSHSEIVWIKALAKNRMISGNIHVQQGGFEDALADYNRAGDLRRILVEEQGSNLHRFDLALTLVNTALTLQYMDRLDDAVKMNREAVDILEQLVQVEKRMEYREYLGSIYYNYGTFLGSAERYDEAERYFSRAVTLFRKLVNREHKKNLMLHLAYSYAGTGNLWIQTDRAKDAIELFEKAIRIGEYRILNEGRIEERGILARFKASRAEALMKTGDNKTAREEFEKVIPVLKKEHARTGNVSFKLHLESIEEMMGEMAAEE